MQRRAQILHSVQIHDGSPCGVTTVFVFLWVFFVYICRFAFALAFLPLALVTVEGVFETAIARLLTVVFHFVSIHPLLY